MKLPNIKHPALAAIAVYVVFLAISGLVPPFSEEVDVFAYFAFCIATGTIEEFVFCFLIFRLIWAWVLEGGIPAAAEDGFVAASPLDPSRKRPFVEAACITALMFGVAHLYFGYGLVCGLLKAVQAFLFSICMVYIYVRTRSLAAPAVLHALFDAVYFAPAFIATSSLPPYESFVAPDANWLLLAATSLLFAACAIIMFRRSM